MDKTAADLSSFRQAWLEELHGTHDPGTLGPLNLPGDMTVPELHGSRDPGPPALLSLPGGTMVPAHSFRVVLIYLDLKLRNQIYDWVIEPCEIHLRLSSIPDLAQNSQSGTSKWSNTRRTTLALTQTCREIRAEVLPLHKRAHTLTKATIRHSSSADEIDVRLLKAINFVGPVHHSIIGGKRFELDILTLCNTAQGQELRPFLSFQTGYGRVVVQRHIRKFIANPFPSRLRHSMITTISSNEIVQVRRRPHLVIVVRSTRVQPWMPFHGSSFSPRWSSTVGQWLRDVGLDAIDIKQGFIDIAVA